MLLKQPAIVLRTVDFRESSCIATLLTPDYGKVAVMARSVRKPGSKLSGLFQQGSVLEVVYYYKESRSVQNLKEASMRRPTYHIREQLEKMALASVTAELVEQLAGEGQPSESLYDFLEKLLSWLHEIPEAPGHLFPYIQLRLAGIMGLGLRLGENLEREDSQASFLSVEYGEVTPEQKNGICLNLSPAQTLYLILALSQHTGALLRNSFSPNEIRNLIHHLDVYLRHHLDGLRDRKSDSVFNQIL